MKIPEEFKVKVEKEADKIFPPLNDFRSASRSGFIEGAKYGYEQGIRDVVKTLRESDHDDLLKFEYKLASDVILNHFEIEDEK